MSAVTATDASLLVFRVGLAVVFLAHGYNHVFGGGKIEGTARWFESLGMRPGVLHAWTASSARWWSHGLRITCATDFLSSAPGEGYEYVMMLTVAAVGLSGTGPGQWSADHVLGWFDPPGWLGLGIALIAGLGGAAGLLATYWRPARTTMSAATVERQEG